MEPATRIAVVDDEAVSRETVVVYLRAVQLRTLIESRERA